MKCLLMTGFRVELNIWYRKNLKIFKIVISMVKNGRVRGMK